MTDFGIPSSFKGRVENFETPDWRPLERLAADDALVLGQFMWMHAVRLEDGRLVHAYKHFETRRYLHLAEDLTAFDCHGEDEHPYRTSTLGIALREVFCLCRELGHPDEAELVAGEALIERHSRYPSVPAASASGGHGARRQGP